MNAITPKQLKDRLDRGETVTIVDVREEKEHAIATLGGLHIPMRELPSRWQEIPADRDAVIVCHHGVRSAHAAGFLLQAGLTRVLNLSGGIDRWATEVDPKMPRY